MALDTPAVGGRGFRVEVDERALHDLITSPTGEVARWLDSAVGPKLAQEAKRLSPVSPHGSHGRPSGYLRSTIGYELGADSDSVYVDYGSHALTPDGHDYGLDQELGPLPSNPHPFTFTPHLRPALDVLKTIT
jgi:hypothetical protein